MPTSGNWDLYRAEDADAVRALHAAQEKRIGRKMDLPDLMEKPVLLALVRRTEGRVSHVIYLEAEVEVCALGETPVPESDWDKVSDVIQVFLVRRGIRIARAFVPEAFLEVKRGAKSRPSPLAKVLERVGLTRDKGPLVPFFRWLI